MANFRNFYALYPDDEAALAATRELLDAGFHSENINMISNDVEGRYARYVDDDVDYDDEDVTADEGAGFGAVVGALTGLGVALIPGVGPILAAGPVGAAIIAGIGAASGAATGGIAAGLIDTGVNEEDAHVYQEGVRRGNALLVVKTDDAWHDRVKSILNNHNPLDINERREYFRNEGWTGYDPDAEPYDANTIREYRSTIHDRY